MRLILATLVPVLLLAACGGRTTTLLADPAATPYAGPMHVERDLDDDATVLAATGAAGLALECTGAPRRGGGGDYVDGGLETVQDSPRAALADLIDEEGVPVPDDGYRVERVEDGRALLSYDVDDRTKVAVIARDDITDFDHDTGWGVEVWAMCDPAELGAEVAERLGLQLWADADGRPVATTEVMSYAGAAHCDWQDLTWLEIGAATDADQDVDTYLSGDEDGALADFLSTTPDASATLPPDATDTGWQRAGRELWLGEHPRAAYLVSVDDRTDVQRWPAVTDPIGCA
ncbi:hypothetical protein [Nocardioides sp. URHA0020]|uniref:hypothetical protein n=1 Tax=Nocardioides sp. URHA0020 TaxID=1380392 RepID=UPI0006846F06|nr:hypothetical protein [Nocardioides sp. URHA0020]